MPLLKNIILTLCILSLQNFAMGSDLDDLQSIEFLTENYPPLNYMKNGNLTGASVEIIDFIFEDLGLKRPKISLVPWSRGYHFVQTDKPVALMTMVRIKSREPLFQWVGPLFVSRHFLLTYNGSNIENYDIEKRFDFQIGAVRNDISETILLESGYPKEMIYQFEDTKTLLNLLRPDRLKLISIPENSFNALSAEMALDPEKFRVLAILKTSQGYLSLSHAVPENVVLLLQRTLDKNSDKHLEILNKYHLKP